MDDELTKSAVHLLTARSKDEQGREVTTGLYSVPDGRFLLRRSTRLAPRAFAVRWEECPEATAREMVDDRHQGTDWIGGGGPRTRRQP